MFFNCGPPCKNMSYQTLNFSETGFQLGVRVMLSKVNAKKFSHLSDMFHEISGEI